MNYWILFYCTVTPLLLFCYFADRKVLKFVRKQENRILDKFFTGSEKFEKAGKWLTIAMFVVMMLFLVNVDKEPDAAVKNKLYGLYGIFILNLIIYSAHRWHEWIIISNSAMLIWCGRMFNIYDNVFNAYLIVNIAVAILLIFLFAERKRSEKAFHRIDRGIFIIAFVYIFQVFYFSSMSVPTGSMLPEIQIGDSFFVNMFTYHFKKPKLNEVVAFVEPVKNKVFYTKRITGMPGTVFQVQKGVEDAVKVYESRDELLKAGEKIDEHKILLNAGGKISSNGKEINSRLYLPEGILGNNKTYIPKKGDEVRLDKIISINKLQGYAKTGNRVSVVDWNGFNQGKSFENVSPQKFLLMSKNYKSFDEMIGNSDDFFRQNYYTFTLKAEGHDEMVLPILDFKRNPEIMKKLLDGKSITLEDDYYIAMGDNTANSFDSRYFGLVAGKSIKGKLAMRWMPFKRFGTVK